MYFNYIYVCCGTVYNSNCTVEIMDRRIINDADLMTKLANTVICLKLNAQKNQIGFLEPLLFKPVKIHFQALFKENWQFSRQIKKSSTFQDSIQIQALGLWEPCKITTNGKHRWHTVREIHPISFKYQDMAHIHHIIKLINQATVTNEVSAPIRLYIPGIHLFFFIYWWH